MLSAVRKFISDITQPDTEASDDVGDERLAAAALLVHISGIDGTVSGEESEKLRALLTDRFGLEDRDLEQLVSRAVDADHEAVDLFGFTSVLKAKLDEEERANIVEMMWEIVFADGEVHEFEDNLVWRVAELLGVSSRDRVRMKQVARQRSEEE